MRRNKENIKMRNE